MHHLKCSRVKGFEQMQLNFVAVIMWIQRCSACAGLVLSCMFLGDFLRPLVSSCSTKILPVWVVFTAFSLYALMMATSRSLPPHASTQPQNTNLPFFLLIIWRKYVAEKQSPWVFSLNLKTAHIRHNKEPGYDGRYKTFKTWHSGLFMSQFRHFNAPFVTRSVFMNAVRFRFYGFIPCFSSNTCSCTQDTQQEVDVPEAQTENRRSLTVEADTADVLEQLLPSSQVHLGADTGVLWTQVPLHVV